MTFGAGSLEPERSRNWADARGMVTVDMARTAVERFVLLRKMFVAMSSVRERKTARLLLRIVRELWVAARERLELRPMTRLTSCIGDQFQVELPTMMFHVAPCATRGLRCDLMLGETSDVRTLVGGRVLFKAGRYETGRDRAGRTVLSDVGRK